MPSSTRSSRREIPAWAANIFFPVALVITGGIIIGVGEVLELSIGNLHLGPLVAHIGALILVISVLHWGFEAFVKSKLLGEFYSEIMNIEHIKREGLVNVYNRGYEYDFNHAIEVSSKFIIGIHYYEKILDDYEDEFRRRCESGKTVAIMHLPEDFYNNPSLAAEFHNVDYYRGCITRLLEKISSIDRDGGRFLRLQHYKVLRYSFVQTDSMIWVNVHANGEHHPQMPAFVVRSGSPLYDQFNRDIEAIIAGASRHA